MSMTTESDRLSATPSRTRKRLRLAAATLCGIIAVLYLVLAVLVARAQSTPEWTHAAEGGGRTMDSIYGMYIFAAVPFLVGAVLAVRLDRQVVWALGALTQVAMIGGFLWLAVQVIGPRGPEGEPTVFDYGPLSGLGMAWWATAITAAQVVLLGVLTYLALRPLHPQIPAATR